MSQNLETFGKYILLEKLQTGGMAEIYLARKPGASGVSKFIAIKRILPQFSEQTEFIDMFKDEAKIAVNLSHANIVSIHEFGVERGQFFLAMDYVEGRNLRQILNKMKKSNATFSIEQVLFVIKEVAGGLDHAHRCIDANTGKPLNIIHRDMSPQNVMVSFEGEVKVVDFGIAKAETQIDSTRAGTLKGKFGYMSPEQAEGQNVDLRTDIFALGIVLWELLANDRLFVANNEINTLRKVRDCQVPSLRKINPNIPPELERIVSKALARDRNLRYQTAAAFQRELNRFLNRQYPDFSQHDFSVFIKTMFSAEILESRKKMVAFSKLEIPTAAASQSPPPATRRPEATTDQSEYAVGSSSYTENTAADEVGLPLPRKKQPAPPVKNQAPPPQQQQAPKPRNKTGVSPGMDTTGLSVDRTSYRDRVNTREGTREGTYFTNNTFNTRGSDISVRSRGPVAAMLPIVLIVVAALAGGLAIFPGGSKSLVTSVVPKLPQGLQALFTHANGDNQVHVESMASNRPTTFDVDITSSPSGAVILIDDKPYFDTTPATLKLKQNGEFKITVRKDGHAQWEQFVKVDKDIALKANLLPERVGRLDINVVGSGEIFVDNRRVAAGSPANDISVPANTDITVTAIDPVTKARDEIHVRVPENTTKKITLIPRAAKN